MRGWPKAVWNFSENSSVLVASPVPYPSTFCCKFAKYIADLSHICIFLVKLWIRTKDCVATTYMCTALVHEAIHYIFVAVVHFWFMGLTQLCLNCPLAFNPSTLPSCSWDHLRGCNSRSWEHPPWLTLRSPRLIAKLVAMRKSSPISKINFFANNLPSHLWRLSSPGLSLLIRSSTYRVFDVVFVSMLSVFWSDHSPVQ